MKNPKTRLDWIDRARGAALCSMLVYHASWDLVWIFHFPWNWYKNSYGAYLWQQTICWSFILLSGYCCHFSRNLVRRGWIVFSLGWLITIATALFMPGNLVLFGVLYLIGAAMIITGLSRAIQRRVTAKTGLSCHIPARLGLIFYFILFLFTRRISSGILGGGVFSIYLPRILYYNNLTAAFGFPYPGFFSTDYFPIFPWIFLFLTGYFLYDLTAENNNYNYNKKTPVFLNFLAFMGRHSLLIYILHQPVIYGILWAVDRVF